MQRRQFLVGMAAASVTRAHDVCASESWPAKPVKWIVPFAPGGGADIIARLASPVLSSALGQQVLVDNRGGASGSIGAEAVAKSNADGYTWLMSNNASIATAPAVYPKAGYDPLKDFSHLFMIGTFANALLVRAEHPARTLADLLALAKRKPGGISFASAGPGSAGHLTGELLMTTAGVDLQHIPYKGTGPALVDLASGQIDALFDGLPASMGYIKSGKLRAIAVTSTERLAALPNVPTIAESFPAVHGGAWFGVAVPAKTPADIAARIVAGGKAALENAEFRRRLTESNIVPNWMNTSQFSGFVAGEIARWAPIIRKAKIAL